MLPNRLRTSSATVDQSLVPTYAVRGRGIVTSGLVAVAVFLLATNVLSLVDSGFHSKAYSLIEGAARASGLESSLASSPTEVNRRAVEVAARQSAEAATREQRIATMRLVADSLVLVNVTQTLVQEHLALRQAHLALTTTSAAVARRVAVRTAASATRSVTTFAGKALPYVGAASIVALTAYDLADACQTLKDANELAIATGNAKGSEEGTICGLHAPSIEQIKTWAGGVLH